MYFMGLHKLIDCTISDSQFCEIVRFFSFSSSLSLYFCSFPLQFKLVAQ